MPEAGAIIPGVTGFLFERDNTDSLVIEIKRWFDSGHNKGEVQKNCREVIDKYYNPQYQMKVFNAAILNNNPLL